MLTRRSQEEILFIINEISTYILLCYPETISHQRHGNDRAAPKKSNKKICFQSDYINHLVKLNLLYMMYIFELSDTADVC